MTALRCNSPPIPHLHSSAGGEQEALLLACRVADVGATEDLWVIQVYLDSWLNLTAEPQGVRHLVWIFCPS